MILHAIEFSSVCGQIQRIIEAKHQEYGIFLTWTFLYSNEVDRFYSFFY